MKYRDRARATDAAVDARQADLIETTLDLVRMPTEVPPGAFYAEIVERLIPRFAAAGFAARRYDLPAEAFAARCATHHPDLVGPRANLLATWPRDNGRGLLWYTHLDVIPAGDRTLWDFDPYAPYVRDGHIWGRGSADSKGAAAAILIAFLALHDIGQQPAINPVIALTTDEEIGPYTGLMHMADHGQFANCDWFHNCDAGATGVGFGYCAAFTWRIRLIGRGGHTGAAHLALNPIERGVSLMQALVSLKTRVEARCSRLTLADGAQLRPAFNMTGARADARGSVVPGEFVLQGDRRIIPEEDWETSTRELEDVVEQARQVEPALGYELTITPIYQAGWAGSAADPFVQRLAALASEVRGEVIAPAGGGAFASDAAHVARVTGIALASHGVARVTESRAHAPNERVRIADLVALAKIIARLATDGLE